MGVWAAGDLGFGIDNVYIIYMVYTCTCMYMESVVLFGSFGIDLKNFMIHTFVYTVCLCPLSF